MGSYGAVGCSNAPNSLTGVVRAKAKDAAVYCNATRSLVKLLVLPVKTPLHRMNYPKLVSKYPQHCYKIREDMDLEE